MRRILKIMFLYQMFLVCLLCVQEVFAQPPTTGASNFSVTNNDGDRLRVNWTRGNGSRVLVIASASPTFGGTGIPADGIDYTASATFGSGNEVGAGNFVVYKSTGTNVTITNFVHSTTYYFRIFEFNGTGSGTQYNTTNVLSGNGLTLSPPTTGSTNMIATPTGNSAALTWTRGNGARALVILQAGSATTDPTQYTNYTGNATFGSGAVIGSGRAVYHNTGNTVNVTNLEPNTVYFYRVVESNGASGPAYNFATALTGSFTTGGAPTSGATNFLINNETGSGLRVNWTRGNGTNVLVVASLSPAFGGTGVPANGTDYTANTIFGSGDAIGTGNFVVYRGTATNVSITGLVHSTTYYFRVYEFNGTNFNTVYNTANVLAGNGSTLFPPTVGATNLIATATGNSASLTWTRGNGTRSLVILQQGSETTDPVQYTNYTAHPSFGSGSAVGSGRVVYFNTSNVVNVTNLLPGTQYFYRVVESNGSSNPVFDLTNALTGSFTTAGAPTVGSTAFGTPSVQGNQFSRSFTAGNGTRRLIVARQDLPVAWTPVNGVDYNANSAFGSGDNLGDNTFVVGETTGSNFTVTNLTPATTYHLAVFEFNGTASNTFYLTDPAHVLTGSVTTLSPPSTSAGNFSFTNITGHSATITFTAGNGNSRIVLVKAGSPVTDVPVNLVAYTSHPNITVAPTLGTSRIVYNSSGLTFSITALQPNTTYHFAVFEYNGSSGPVYKQADPGIGSFVTLGKPTVAPTSLAYTNIQGNQMTLNYATGNGFGRTVIAKQGAPVDVFPADLTSYTASATFGTAGAHLGNGNYVIQNNTTIGGNTSTGINGLTIGQDYHFAIIEYNGTGAARIYMTGAEALTGNNSTLSAPTVQATNVTFSNITSNTLTISWLNGNGNGRIVLLREGQAVQSLPVNLTSYTSSASYPSSPTLGGTSRIVYNGTGTSVNIINIPPGNYHVAIIEYNGTSGPVYRTADPLTGNVNVGDKPPIPATNLSFSNIQGNQMTLSFTQGNGLSRMIVAKAGSPVDAWPEDFTGYTANSNFGSGADLGGGNFVVGSSTGNFFTINNLLPNSTYHVAVVEFNGSGATALYQLPAIVATASNTTLSAPTITTSNFFANNITGNSMQLTWTRGNGANRLVIARAGAPVDVVPADLSSPNGHPTFGSGTNYGNGNFAVYNGSGDNFTLTNLEPGTTYHFAFFEYNGTTGRVYLTDPVGRASFTTAPRPSVAARNLNVSSVNGDRFNLSFTNGNGTRRLVVMRKGGLVNELPTDLTTYTAGSFGAGSLLADGNYVVAFGTLNSIFSVTGLEPNTQYGVAVFELDGSNGNQRYLVTEYINQLVSTAVTPPISTSSLLINSIGSTSANISWTNGSGEGRMVVLRPAQPVTFLPTVLNTHPSANANVALTTNNLTLDHKHVYRGAGTNVTITNLQPGTTYHVAFFEYNGTGQPVYSYLPLTGFFTTLPATGLAIGGFDAITFCPAQQVDVPYIFTGVFNTGNVLSVELSDITGSFATPTVLGIQSTTNATGFVTSTLPASLPEGIGYRLRVRATNPASLSADNGADLQITTSVQPTFTVVGGSTSSCGTPIQLTTSQPNYNLQWFRNGQPIAGATTSSHFATQTGDYQVRISGASGGCQLLSASTTLTITQEPVYDFLFNSAYCITDVIDLVPLTQPAGGTWSGPGITGGVFNTTTAGIGQHLVTYTYVDAVSLCSFSTTTQILVSALPAAPTTLAGSGCQLTGIALTAMGANVTESYQWYTQATGDTPITGATLATFITPPLTATTSYFVSIVSASGCEGPRTEAIATVTTVAKPTITSTGSTSICGAGSVTLHAPTGFASYLWSTGETTQSITVTAADDYTVVVRDAGGCESENADPISVTVNQPPQTPQITVVGNLTICPGQPITLRAPAGFTYLWSTGVTTQELIVTSADSYIVTITDANGCTSTSQPVITTPGACEIIIYNGISPNGDDKNEIFFIQHIDQLPDTQNNTVTIYNRWGDVVWEGKNYDNTTVVFRGLNKSGNELPNGTYFYKIEFAGNAKAMQGYISLKR
ncbi:MAG: gliding motility-associated C-terminal domain-containing protein [Cyclobacteriaceae bacterium]|nr:gliding motility-associated C-terminal domain-containing protein [Cyclobacteriaceae bacterium]